MVHIPSVAPAVTLTVIVDVAPIADGVTAVGLKPVTETPVPPVGPITWDDKVTLVVVPDVKVAVTVGVFVVADPASTESEAGFTDRA